MSAPRCPRCDREGCRTSWLDWVYPTGDECQAAHAACKRLAVDWRARALSERAAREQAETRATSIKEIAAGQPRGRATIEGADWSRWKLVPIEALQALAKAKAP